MDSTEKDDNPILFFGGEILIIFMEGGTPTSPFAENAAKTITLRNSIGLATDIIVLYPALELNQFLPLAASRGTADSVYCSS